MDLNSKEARWDLVSNLIEQVRDRLVLLHKKISRGEPQALREISTAYAMQRRLSELREIMRDEDYLATMAFLFLDKASNEGCEWAKIACNYSYAQVRRFVFERVCRQIKHVSNLPPSLAGGTPSDEWDFLRDKVNSAMYDLEEFYKETFNWEDYYHSTTD